MSDTVPIAEFAFSQYAVIKNVFKYLDYESAKNMSSLRKGWRTHAQRRFDESDVKTGQFLEADFSESLLTEMESTAGVPSAVFFFSSSNKDDFRRRLQSVLQAKPSWENTIVVVAGVYLSFDTMISKNVRLAKQTMSYLALPAGIPVSSLTSQEFNALKCPNSDLDRNFLIFTDTEYPYPSYDEPKSRKRKLKFDEQTFGKAAGGIYREVWCKTSKSFCLEKLSFLTIAITSVRDRLTIELGQARKKWIKSKAPIATNPTSIIVFPCGALTNDSNKYRTTLSAYFPGLTSSVVGGSTTGEWYGKFSREDLKLGEDELMCRLQKIYSFYFAALTVR